MLRLFATLLLLALPVVARAQADGPRLRPSGPVFHLRLAGDIECAQDVRGVRAVLEEAAAAQAPLIIIEVGGNNLRVDLVGEVCGLVHESRVPVGVYLGGGEDKVVGPGQLCVGMMAARCAIAPGTAVRGMIGAPGLAALMPEKTDTAVVADELYERVGKAASARGLPEGLLAGVVSPTRPVWAVFGGEGAKIVVEKPAGDVLPVVVEVRGTLQLSLDSKGAARLGLAEELPHWTAVTAKMGVASSSRTDRVLETGLVGPSRRVKPLLDRIDADEDELKTILKLPWPVPKARSPQLYRDAAAKAGPRIEDATKAIAELEQMLSDYPELMRRPAPDQTEVGGKPSTYATRWRSMVQLRRDRIARQTATAEKFAKAREGTP